MDHGNVLYAGVDMRNFYVPMPDQDNPAGIDISREYMAPNHALPRMRYRNYAEVEAFEGTRHTAKLITDPTYPQNDQEDLAWVRAVLYMMLNMEDLVDGQKMQDHWLRQVVNRPERVEYIAWHIVRRVKEYHQLNGRLDPDNPDNLKAIKFMSFADHMNSILPALKTCKTVCRHLIGYDYTNTFIDGVKQSMGRITSNRRVNKTKKVKSDMGTAAAQKVANLGLPLEEDEVEELVRNGRKRNRQRKAAPVKKARGGRKASTSTDAESSELSSPDADYSDDFSAHEMSPAASAVVPDRIKLSPVSPTRTQSRYNLRRQSNNQAAQVQSSIEDEENDLRASTRAASHGTNHWNRVLSGSGDNAEQAGANTQMWNDLFPGHDGIIGLNNTHAQLWGNNFPGNSNATFQAGPDAQAWSYHSPSGFRQPTSYSTMGGAPNSNVGMGIYPQPSQLNDPFWYSNQIAPNSRAGNMAGTYGEGAMDSSAFGGNNFGNGIVDGYHSSGSISSTGNGSTNAYYSSEPPSSTASHFNFLEPNGGVFSCHDGEDY